MIIAFLVWRRKRSRYNAAATFEEKGEQGVEPIPYSPQGSTPRDSKRNPFGGIGRGRREAASESSRTMTHTEATALSPQQEIFVHEVDGGVRLFPLSSEDDEEEPTNVRILPPVYSQYGLS